MACLAAPPAQAHNLDTGWVYMFFDGPTQAILDNRIASTPPGTPILETGDKIGLVIKIVPNNGTTTGVGGYVDFYIPNGVRITDAAYLRPDGSGGFSRVAMKGQSQIAIGSGPVGAKCTPALGDPGRLVLGPNYLGVTADAVNAAGCHTGTIAGVYGDVGIFFSVSPETAYGTYLGPLAVNNSGDSPVGLRTSLGTIPNKWDSEQLFAFGSKSPALPIVDPDGRGNAPWGTASAVAGPQSGYQWGFDVETCGSPACGAAAMKAAFQTGPWQRIKYPGSTIAFDQPGLVSSVLGQASIDAGNIGFDLGLADLPPTVAQNDGVSPNVIRWSIGQLTFLRPEYVFVEFEIEDVNEVPTENGCPIFHGLTFGGDAGGTDNGKDHIWRYYDPNGVKWNACLAGGKVTDVPAAKVGDIITYKIQVYNAGTTAMTNVVATDTLPSGVSFISASPVQNSGPNPLRWNIGTLLPGSKWTASLTVRITGTGELRNRICFDSDQLQNCSDEIIANTPILYSTKTAEPTTIAPGQPVTYTIRVDNIGSQATGNPVVITEILPEGFTFSSLVSVVANSASFTATTTINAGNPNQPVFTVPTSLQAGRSLFLTFVANTSPNLTAGEYCNRIVVTQNRRPEPSGILACVTVGGNAIGDYVWRDWNGDGIQDPGEEGIPGVVLELRDGVCTPGVNCPTTTTDADGFYRFSGLSDGTYTVAVLSGVPVGYTQTYDLDGLGTPNEATVVVTGDQELLTVDFGYLPGGTGVIGDLVFQDNNNDGIFNGADVGIPGVTVFLYEDSNGDGVLDPAEDLLIATTITGPGGLYSFTGLAEGLDYLVQVDPADPVLAAYFAPNTSAPSTPTLVPVPNLTGTFNDADFGFWEVVPASIGDLVFLDNDGNGAFSPGDIPLGNIEVRLYRDIDGDGIASPSELIATTSTGPDGSYLFPNLGPDNYIVIVSTTDPDLPAGVVATVRQYTISLSAGEDRLDADFPFVPLIIKTVDVETAAAPPQNLTYTIRVNAPGDQTISNLQVIDRVPTGTTFVSASHGGVPVDGIVRWNLGSTTPGIDGTVTTTPFIFALRGDGQQAFWRYNVTTNAWSNMANFGANVKEGGALAWNGGNLIYGLQGNNTKAFRSYNIATNTWAPLASIPSVANVRPGGALVHIGGFVYAMIGNGSQEFFRFDPGTNTWLARANTPAAVGEGGALATDGTFIYALRGAGNNSFWRYDPALNTWTVMANAPANVKQGGALVFAPAVANAPAAIYGFRGDGKRDFWRYNIATNSWTSLAPFPQGVRAGGALTYRTGRVYALRGDGKKEFYRYDIATNAWTRLADTAQNVKWGGSLASVVGGDEFTTSASTSPTVANHGETLTVTLAIGSTVAVNNVAPPAAGLITVTPTGGASATYASGPTPASVNIPAGGVALVSYTYTVAAGAATVPQSLTFAFPGFTSGIPSTTWAATTSHSAIVVPNLTMTVNANVAGQIDNIAELTGVLQDGNANCLMIANSSGGGADDADHLVIYDAAGVATLGLTGTTHAQALRWDPAGSRLYTVDRDPLVGAGSDLFGRIDINTGQFVPIGRIVQPGNPLAGSLGPIATLNVVGLAFDPTNGELFAIHRRADSNVNNTLLDVMFKINPNTGLHIENAFGAGNDYRVITTNTLTPALYDIDDITFDPVAPNSLFAIANDTTTGFGDGDRLITINKSTGAVTNIGRIFIDLNDDGLLTPGEELNDVEGLSFSPTGTLFATTGDLAPAPFANVLLTIDPETGEAAVVEDDLPFADYEAVSCRSNTPFAAADDAKTGIGALIGDFVWLDSNGDGIQDAGEPGIPGVRVYLDLDANGVFDWVDLNGNGQWDPGEGDRWVYTDLEGKYLFAGLAVDTYWVRIDMSTVPSGYFLTTPGAIEADLGLTPQFTTADFGLKPPGNASIGDTVWLDADNDGTQGLDELGLPGITVFLYVDTNNDGILDLGDTLIATTTTDANGNYLFSGLYAGNYLVIVDETSLVTSPYGPVATLGDAMQPTVGTSNPRPVVVPFDNSVITDADFGYNWSGSIGDFTWYDDNGNGLQDEIPLLGAPSATLVLVFDANGNGKADIGEPVLGTYETDATGFYIFENLPPGNYVVSVSEQEIPAPPSSPNAGEIERMVPTTGGSIGVTLGAGENRTDVDFGFIEGAVVEGSVYHDRDLNGLRDDDEIGLAGITVTLTGTDFEGNPVLLVTVTDADGDYEFIVPPGDYVISYDSTQTTAAGFPNPTSPTELIITVSAGQELIELDFGVSYPGRVGDTVFVDIDGDGVQGPGEPGLPGVTVRLYDATGTTLLATTVTDGQGQYLFSGLADGNYVVRIEPSTVPTGYAATADPDEVGVCVVCDYQGTATVIGGGADLTVDFGFQPSGPTHSVAGTVYNDDGSGGGIAGDGSQNGTEPGLAGVEVAIEVDLDNDGVVDLVFTVITDTNGNYSLAGIPAGSDVTITVIPSTLPGSNFTQSGDPDSACPGLGCNHSTTITGLFADVFDQDFGYVQTRLGDRVWYDTNADGIQDPGEMGIAGVTVRVFDATGTVLIATTQTDGSGDYEFVGLPIGSYIVEFVPPAGYVFSPQDAGGNVGLADSFDSDADPGTGRTGIIVLSGVDVTVDAGMYIPGSDPARIGDRVWYDTNGDGIQNAGEPGVAGVIVRLYDSTGTQLIASTVTDGNGSYEFAGLAAGDYIVEFVAPAYTFSPANQGANDAQDSDADPLTGRTGIVSLAAGDNRDDIDAGISVPNVAPASIGDRVWYDTNGDGIQDLGEPGIPGVQVNLYNSFGNLIATTTTDLFGNYAFTGLLAGDYIVEFKPPTGSAYVSSPADQGMDDSVDSDADPVTGRVALSLASGEVNDTVDAGFYVPFQAPITLGDLVWIDLNVSGTFDPGEGLAGAVVVLYDGFGNELVRTATDPTGAYFFSGLAPGDYRVAVDTGSLPANLTQIDDPDGVFDSRTDLFGVIADDLTVDFGYQPPAPTSQIAGVVYIDEDGDGLYTPGIDTPLVGVEVEITDSNNQVITVVTTINGVFSALVPPGNTIVDIVDASLPPLVTLTTDANGEGSDPTVVLVPLGGTGFDNTGYLAPGLVQGTVYLDVDADGLYTPGIDIPLSGVEILITDSEGNTYTVVTNADGYFSQPVPAGSTTVDIDATTLPSGAALTVGSTDPTVVNVPPGGVATDDTGYVMPPGSGLVDGTIFIDANGNGVFDPGVDVVLPGVEVLITDSLGNESTVVTNADGYFIWPVPAGETTVDVVDSTLPPGAFLTSNGSGQGSDPTVVTVPPNGVATDNTGYVILPGSGLVEGIVYSDDDGNGVYTPGVDTPLAGVTVAITTPNGGVYFVQTDADGYFSQVVPPGLVTVDVIDSTLPAGSTLAPGSTDPTVVNVPLNGVGVDNTGYDVPGLVQGTIFQDVDNDGIYTIGTDIPLVGVEVLVTDRNGNEYTLVTDGNGFFSQAVPAGATTVDVVNATLPPNLVLAIGNTDPTIVSVPPGGIGVDNTGYTPQPPTPTPALNPDLWLQKSHVGAMTVGQTGQYNFTVKNVGNGPTVGPITVTDSLPNGLSFVSGGGGAWACGANGQVVTCTTNAILAPSAVTATSIIVQVGSAAYPTVTNVATVTTANDTNSGNNTATDPTTIRLGSSTPTPTPTATATAGPGTPTPTSGVPTATPTLANPATITGTVFNDINGNGAQNTNLGEAGIPGVTIQLLDSNGVIVATTTTNANGQYTFTGLPAGNYTVVEIDPEGYVSTTPNSVGVVLSPGGTKTVNFGDQLSATPPPATPTAGPGTPTLPPGTTPTATPTVANPATITGTVFNDINGNGAQNTNLGEAGIPGVTIQLLDSNGVIVATTTTNANGQYTFTGLPAGNYTVVQIDLPGYTSTTPNSIAVVLSPGGTKTANFGDQLLATPPPASTPTATPGGPTAGPATPTPTPTAFVDIALSKHSLLNFKTCSVGTFEYRIRNMGTGSRGSTVGPITITDNLHPSLTYLSFAGQGWTCEPAGTGVTCVHPAPLAPNALTVVTVDVYVDQSAFPTITTSAEVSTLYDGNLHNNFQWVATTVSRGSCDGQPTPTSGVASPTPVGTPLPTSSPTPTATPDPFGCDLSVASRYVGIPRPGGNIEYRLTWSHSCRDALNLLAEHTVPAGMELLSVDLRDGTVTSSPGLVSITQSGRPAGVQSAVLRMRILPSVAPGVSLCGVARAADSYGRVRQADACFQVLGGTESLRTALHGHLLTRPGRQLTYTARYFGVRPDNRLVMELPERATLIDIQPPYPDEIDGRLMTWHDLPAVSGKVRYTIQVDYDAPPGSILNTAMEFADTFGREFRQHNTVIVASSSPSGDTTIGQLTLVGPRTLRPGQTTAINTRYRKVADSGELVIHLAPELDFLDSVPAATVGDDGGLRWAVAGSPTSPASSTVKIQARVRDDTPLGTVLTSRASLTTTSAAANAENHIVLKTVEAKNESSMLIAAPRRVVAGLTAQIGIKLRRVPGPVVVELALPPELTPILTIPAARVTESGKLAWTVDAAPGSFVSFQPKIRAHVAPTATQADQLSLTATATGVGGTLSATAVLEVREIAAVTGGGTTSSPASGTGAALTLTGSRSVKAGLVTSLKVQYRGLGTPGQLEMHLPPGLGPIVSTVPAATVAPDGRIVWSGMRPGSGTAAVKVITHPGLPSGQVLTATTTLTDAHENTSEASFVMAIR